MKISCTFPVFLLAVLVTTVPCTNGQDPTRVRSQQKISDTEGNFSGMLEDLDFFGIAVVSLGDFDGDGLGDIAVGDTCDDGGGACRGAVWLLMLNADGTVKTQLKIADAQGGFTGTLDDSDGFGFSLASLGDLDGDGVDDLAVGAIGDDDGGLSPADRGAVWILFLNANGTVKAYQKISDTQSGFTGTLDDGDFFGWSVVSPGDLDDDGIADLAVGSYHDDDGGFQTGAVWILFLNADGTVKAHQKISATQGGFTGPIFPLGVFGFAVAALGDLDGDGVEDLAVGNPGDYPPGAVWILFLNTDGTVKAEQKISDVEGGFRGHIEDGDVFGTALSPIGDLDGDGIQELAVGAGGDSDGGPDRGAVWILFLNPDGTVKAQRKISATRGGFTGQLDELDYFGRSVTSLGDLDGDGFGDLAVGAVWDDDGGTDRGAVWILFLGGARPTSHRLPFSGTIHPGDTLELPVLAGGEKGSPIAGPATIPLLVLGTRALPAERTTRSGLAIDPRSVLSVLFATEVRVPGDPSLVGRTLYTQALFLDAWHTGPPRLVAGRLFELRID